MMAWKTVTAGLVLLLLPPPIQAQEDSLPSGTYAQRGMVVGGVAGGAAGAFLVGLLSQALCEYECDGALVSGALLGGAGGAVLGGLTGLVVGAAIPRNASEGSRPAPEEPGDRPPPESRTGIPSSHTRNTWALRAGVGLTGPVHAESEEVRTWTSLAILRAISSRVDWGVEAGYLGTRRETNVYTIPITQADTAIITTKWKRSLWSASLMALRRVGNAARPSGYLLATAGVYPYQESVKGTRTGDPREHPARPPRPDRSTDPLPGVGVGGGGRWRLGKSVGLGMDGRLHLILGAPDELGVVVASLGATIWLGG